MSDNAIFQYIVLHQSCRNHPGVTACQAAHAAGESVRANSLPSDTTSVCALVAETSDELEALSARLREAGVHHVLVKEPDPPYRGAATAVGIEPQERHKVRDFVSHFKLFR
jgi:hypothetical protein